MTSIFDKKVNEILEKSVHDPVRPGILKRQTKGKLTCTKARALKAKQKNKGNNTAKAAQRYLNYHCEDQDIREAEYRGRKVKLNKPMRGDVKKFKVYVKDPKTGNVKKVNFGHKGKGGEKTMRIRKNNPKARKSFRARHNCDNPGPRTKARYWSCRKW